MGLLNDIRIEIPRGSRGRIIRGPGSRGPRNPGPKIALFTGYMYIKYDVNQITEVSRGALLCSLLFPFSPSFSVGN